MSNDDVTRRDFLAAAAAAGGAVLLAHRLMPHALLQRAELDPDVVARIPGEIVGQSMGAGHMLRDAAAAPWIGRRPVHERRVRTAIVGSGIAGLSAAWAFDRAGWNDYLVLELEPIVGGTSSFHEYDSSGCPWGAHYLPKPTPESRAVRLLLAELGVLTGYRPDGTPEYDEVHLCHAPQERLFINGVWQEGVWPARGATPSDNVQLDAFHADMERWRARTGRDGRSGFAIPIAFSSRDPEFLALDRISMREYMRKQGWTSPRLYWYVEYATRDDYGCTLDQTSAWAGIHYFTSRSDRPRRHVRKHDDADDVLTWPEGNGWIVRRLRDRVGAGRLVTQALVFGVDVQGKGAVVDWWDGRDVHRVVCDEVVLAVPRHVATRICPQYGPDRAKPFSYAPWVVSNVVVDRRPANHGPASHPIAWDNVFYDSDSLGYVVSTHQSLATVEGPGVLTHYHPLAHGDPRQARALAMGQGWGAWRDNVLRDLSVPHPGIECTVQRLDVMVWGHAMVRPTPGLMWAPARELAARGVARLAHAHTDLSGVALFEEAQYHGVRAAQDLMRAAGHGYEDVL